MLDVITNLHSYPSQQLLEFVNQAEDLVIKENPYKMYIVIFEIRIVKFKSEESH